MRRSEREVTDNGKINEIIKSCKICRLGFNDNGRVYIVSMSFGFEEREGKRYFYFHSAFEGRKIDLIKTSPYVGFEADTGYELIEGNTPCSFSAAYQSIIGNGKIAFVKDREDKARALNLIMKSATGKDNWKFPPQAIEKVCVFCLEVEEISCKEHIK